MGLLCFGNGEACSSAQPGVEQESRAASFVVASRGWAPGALRNRRIPRWKGAPHTDLKADSRLRKTHPHWLTGHSRVEFSGRRLA